MDLEAFKKKYEPDVARITINGKSFQFFVPSTLEPFMNTEDPHHHFPLWAKIWEASLVLAEELAQLRPDPQKQLLEIGAGLGTVGIIASFFGHQVTITEYDDYALAFAQANAHLNQVSPVSIQKLDWHDPQLKGQFHLIFGSEIVYKEQDYQPLLALFQRYLRPKCHIVLADGLRRTSLAFFGHMSNHFHVEGRKKVLRSQNSETTILLCSMTPK